MSYGAFFSWGLLKKKKKKKPLTAKQGRENITKSQWEVKIKTNKLSEVREIAPDQAANLNPIVKKVARVF